MIKQHSKKNILIIPVVCFLIIFGMLIRHFHWEYWTEIVIFLIMIIACLAPACIQGLKHAFDPFEPVYSISLATFVYFVFMGISIIQSESYYMSGISYREEIPKVLLYALLALLSFYTGYYGYSSSKKGKHSQSIIPKSDYKYLRHLSWLTFGFFILLVILWIVIGRIPLSSLWIFGEAKYGSWWQEAEGAKIGYLYAAREALTACILLIIAFRKQYRWQLSVIFLSILIFTFYSGTGGRSRVLLITTSITAFYYIEKFKRPRLWQIAILSFLIFYFVIGGIGYYRGTDKLIKEEYNLEKAYITFEKSSNILVASAVSIKWIPDVFDYRWGKDYLNIIIMPIPSFIWSGKHELLASGTRNFLITGAASAFFINFYQNFGAIGVVTGMVIIGILCRKIYFSYILNPNDKFSQIMVAMLWGFLLHAYGRGSASLIFYGTIYVFAPIWTVKWLYKINRKRSQNFINDFSGKSPVESSRVINFN